MTVFRSLLVIYILLMAAPGRAADSPISSSTTTTTLKSPNHCSYNCAAPPGDPMRCQLGQVVGPGVTFLVGNSTAASEDDCLRFCARTAAANQITFNPLVLTLTNAASCPIRRMPCIPLPHRPGDYPRCANGCCLGICTVQQAGGTPLCDRTMPYAEVLSLILKSICGPLGSINCLARDICLPTLVTNVPGRPADEPVSITDKDLLKKLAEDIQLGTNHGLKCSFGPLAPPTVVLPWPPANSPPVPPNSSIRRNQCGSPMKSIILCPAAGCNGRDCTVPNHMVQVCAARNANPPPDILYFVFDPNDATDLGRPLTFTPPGCADRQANCEISYTICMRLDSNGNCLESKKKDFGCMQEAL